jgi:cytochrome c-type biogenesis protein CcmH
VALVWAHPAHPAHADNADQVDSIAGNLMCQCGCGLTVLACGDTMECTPGDQMKAMIRKQLADGKTEGEVINHFKELYGEVVLAAPTKSGFNLTAWVTPFAAIAFAGAALGGFIWVWVSRRGSQPVAASGGPGGKKGQDRYAERVERELETLE